jgi:hypothetical protein
MLNLDIKPPFLHKNSIGIFSVFVNVFLTGIIVDKRPVFYNGWWVLGFRKNEKNINVLTGSDHEM